MRSIVGSDAGTRHSVSVHARDAVCRQLTILPMLSSPNSLLALKLLFCGLALMVAGRLAQRATGGLDSAEAERVLAAVVAGAFFGSKLFFVLQYPLLAIQLVVRFEWVELWTLAAGYSIPGAVAGAAGGLAITARERCAVLADALTPALLYALLILAVGRHFWSLSEPGHGAPTRSFGLNFGDGALRHPVMWYDAICAALMLWGHRAMARQGVSVPGLRACVLWGAWFGAALLLAFLKPPFGPILLIELVHPRAVLYPPGLTAEQWLCVVAAAVLAWQSVRLMRRVFKAN